jgi:hypothetical protein
VQVAVDPAELIEQNGSQEVRRSPPDLPGPAAAGLPGPTPSKDHPCHACARPSRACATPLAPARRHALVEHRGHDPRGWSDSRGGQAPFADSVICAIDTICSSATVARPAVRAGESYSADADHGGPASLVGWVDGLPDACHLASGVGRPHSRSCRLGQPPP